MSVVNNNYVDKIIFLPDDIFVVVNTSWCTSCMHFLENSGLYDELIKSISDSTQHSTCMHDSPSFVSKHVKIKVGILKQILDVCGNDTFTFIAPHNYNQVSSDFLFAMLGDKKTQIETFMALQDYDGALSLIDGFNDGNLKHMALVYLKTIYEKQFEEEISKCYARRRTYLNKVNEKIKGSQTDNC